MCRCVNIAFPELNLQNLWSEPLTPRSRLRRRRERQRVGAAGTQGNASGRRCNRSDPHLVPPLLQAKPPLSPPSFWWPDVTAAQRRWGAGGCPARLAAAGPARGERLRRPRRCVSRSVWELQNTEVPLTSSTPRSYHSVITISARFKPRLQKFSRGRATQQQPRFRVSAAPRWSPPYVAYMLGRRYTAQGALCNESVRYIPPLLSWKHLYDTSLFRLSR